jgi:hypothetical protein
MSNAHRLQECGSRLASIFMLGVLVGCSQSAAPTTGATPQPAASTPVAAAPAAAPAPMPAPVPFEQAA